VALRVAIIGCGYVGLVSAVCLAAKGHEVTSVDGNSQVVRRVSAGEPHIYERGLPELLSDVLASGNFRITDDLESAIADADGVIVAVGTPTEHGRIDLRHIERAVGDIGRIFSKLGRFLPVIVKSTVLPGVTDTFVRGILESTTGRKLGAFGLGMNPEFLREGDAISDFMEPDRIVLGHEDASTRAFLTDLYAPWDCDKLYVNTRTAELIKYANNALLATQISAINEIANLAAAVGGIDVMDVVRGVHLDKRWNPIHEGRRIEPPILTYLVPGCGFGGSCFPKDVQALRALGESVGSPMPVLDAVLAVNEVQPLQVLSVLKHEVSDLAGQIVLVLGLTFKPETDDVRESPSLKIVGELVAEGARVQAHDPKGTDNFRVALGVPASKVEFVDDWRKHLSNAAIVVVVTRWDEYLELAVSDLAGKVVFDARRLLSAAELKGARYLSIGRRL
jgi:UDPglucose 6-dehydrogenase/GDP-mannose 6-dehydrogenase